MRKLLVCGLVAVFSFTFLNAQDDGAATPISYGAKAGVNFTQFSGNDEHSDMATRFHFGVLAEIGISDVFAIQPEILFSAQGSDYSGAEEMSVVYDGSFKLNYLNIPVMAKYYVIDGLSVEVGPQVGILLSAKEEYDSDVDSGEIDFLDDEGFEDTFKKTDFGVNFGVGYKLDNGLNFYARYYLGLSDINDDSDGYLGDETYRNNVIQVGVGFFFL